ncbi:hypothetical protein BD626DRAFT_573700 [Schizophyllum amplum]|uniref:Uncharacterized protein n=1 Tax=Schizophyllum amplum TaxID=97359 RepID=A0A550C0K5_9AGAR|nr:hypothetical protein BD626DRAFT_573700 [Auriculariopsis ampla]
MPTVDETRAAVGEPDTRAATDEPEAHTAAPEVQRRPSTAARWQANAWEDYARRLSFAIAAAGPPPSSGARETADAIFSPGHSTSPGDQRAPAYRRSTAPSPSPSAHRENAARHRSEVERNKRQNEVARIQRQQTESRTKLHIPVPFDIPSTDSPIPIDLPIPISTPILTESPTGAISPTLSELPLFDDVLRDGSLLYPTSPFPTSQDVGSLSPATSVVSVFRDVAPGNASSDVQLSVENPTPPLTEERPPSQPAAQPLRSGLPYFSRELDAWAAKQEKPPPSKSYQPNLPLNARHKVSNKTASYSAVATPNSARQARTVDSSSKQRLSTSRPTVGSMILADLPIQAVSAGRLTFADLGAGYRLRPNPGQMYSPNPGLTSDFATEQTCDSDDSFDSLFDEITDQNVQGPSTSGILARDDIGVGRRRKASLDNILQDSRVKAGSPQGWCALRLFSNLYSIVPFYAGPHFIPTFCATNEHSADNPPNSAIISPADSPLEDPSYGSPHALDETAHDVFHTFPLPALSKSPSAVHEQLDEHLVFDELSLSLSTLSGGRRDQSGSIDHGRELAMASPSRSPAAAFLLMQHPKKHGNAKKLTKDTTAYKP